MRGIPSLLRTLAIPLLIGVLASGCAAGRSVVDIQVPEAAAPESGKPVKIVAVNDLRRFEVNPNDPSKPSIGDAKEILDPGITSHAIGRKRGGYGNAMGDLALPDNKTAASVVRDAVRTALQRRGYRAVEEGSSDYAQAAPLVVDVDQFWIWMRPGFVQVEISLESQLTLAGKELVGDQPAVVVGHATTGPGSISNWTTILDPVIRAGLDDLIGKIELKLKPPAGIAATPNGSSVARADAGS